ncbi:uncharacterized protein LOC133519130 isoform X3 [Cydia pomonella]|uniref:uncharacterized protein LOC133519130 isoform X3 n=1 Tax=Cydia pomonella TaxID=82600 RepID=UPI002ADD93F6|nr:uncharacterized protein LOC133519130 isoform X3 [Cydia pomonella]
MEICCLEECGANSVRPVLIAPRCNDAPVDFYPCLPACTKTYYCCEKPKPKESREESSRRGECRHSQHKMERRPCSPPNNHQDCYVVRPPSPRPPCCEPQCKPTKTKYIIPCYRYEDGRIVRRLPVTAFKRNGMQDQEHGKVQGATNFLQRCPRDVELECDVSPKVKVCDPAKVPVCDGKTALCCRLLQKPIKVSLEDILDD